MKKVLSLLVLVLLSACLMGFAFDRLGPGAHPAASASHPIQNDASPAQTTEVPLAPAVQLAAFVVAGLACVLFCVLAVAPLVLNDSRR